MTVTLWHLVLVMLGGALGGIARHWLSGVVARRFGERFPWGTLAVNVSGAALIGALAALALLDDGLGVARPSLWALFVIGILGSYTTVSSFSLQTLALMRSGESARAAANVFASVVLCLAAAALAHFGAGLTLGR